ncbi:MAG: ATP-binding protein [Patescibacteria group bacterium]
MHKSIRLKLFTAFLTIIAVFTIVEGFFIAINFNIVKRYQGLTDIMVSEYRLIGTTADLIESFKSFIKYTGDDQKRQDFLNTRGDLRGLLVKIDSAIVDTDSRVAFTGLRNTITKIIAEVDSGLAEATRGDYSQTTIRYDNANRLNSFVKDNTTSLLLFQLAYAKSLEAEIGQIQIWSEIVALLMFLVAAAGSLWYAISFSNKIVAPLIGLTRLAKAIEGGDLKAVVGKEILIGDDEVASLANSFNMMVFSLRQSIKKLQSYNLEIKDSRNRLKAEKNKLQQYLDIAGVIVMIFSPHTNNVFLVNKKGRELLGIEAGEIMGKDWVGLFVSANTRLKTKAFLNLLISGATPPENTLENVLITKDNKQKNLVWHFSLLKNESGAPQAVLATGVDVTELTAAKVTINQLKELDRLKNEVMNIATHELKTPLISIVGLSEVMEKKPEALPPDYRNYVSIIHQEGVKLTNLIKSMLSASRNELGKITVVKEKFDLAELARSLQTSLSILVKRTDSQVAFDIQGEGFAMESDRAKISQVIYNFVDNAVKYGPRQQTIKIALSKLDAHTAKVAVTGAGEGISEEDQKKLFLKFSQLEPSLSRSQDGMGLGLYICKQNIENLGGQIGVFSQPKQGATFYFTLPLAASADAKPAAAPGRKGRNDARTVKKD